MVIDVESAVRRLYTIMDIAARNRVWRMLKPLQVTKLKTDEDEDEEEEAKYYDPDTCYDPDTFYYTVAAEVPGPPAGVIPGQADELPSLPRKIIKVRKGAHAR